MSFLDSLENSLKSLESVEEQSGTERKQKAEDRATALQIAPWADRLKQSEYLKQFMDEAARAGHQARAKVYMSWLGHNFRLDMREKRMELRPGKDGIKAVVMNGIDDLSSKRIDLEESPVPLIQDWAKTEETTD